MSGTAAAWPLYVAVADAINGDSAASALLGGDRVYNLTAPRDVAFDYIVLAGVTENEYYAFAGGGSSCVLTLNLWNRGDDGANTAKLYGELHRVFNRKRIAVDGFSGAMVGELSLVDIQNDPTGGFVHGIARYACTLFRAA